MPAVALEEVLDQEIAPPQRGRKRIPVFNDEQWAKVHARIIESGNKHGVYMLLSSPRTDDMGNELPPLFTKSESSFNDELADYLQRNGLVE